MKTPKIPEIRLISHTEYPVETLLAVWMQSRPTKFPEFFKWLDTDHATTVATAELVKFAVERDVIDNGIVADTFLDVVSADLPVSESIHFTWGFSNLPIEWREQAVRKRLWGFWLTSMREFTMDDFWDDGRFCPPPDGSVSEQSLVRFSEMQEQIQQYYRELQNDWGWPPEKARKIVSLSATHNGSMFTTFRTLRATLQARSCWIAAIDQWAPWITSVTSEIRNVDSRIGSIVSPPCFKEGKDEFLGCKYKVINKNRLSGNDDYAPCPLYCIKDTETPRNGLELGTRNGDFLTVWESVCKNYGVGDNFIADAKRLVKTWRNIWGRDVFTGRVLTINELRLDLVWHDENQG